jgi:hypothetical protein
VSELEEYYQNLMTDIRREADVCGILMVEAFFDRMAERLTGAGELETADRSFFQIGDSAQKVRIDGYAGDPRDSQGKHLEKVTSAQFSTHSFVFSRKPEPLSFVIA